MPAGPLNDSGSTPATLTSVLFRRRVRPAIDAAPSFSRQNRSPITTAGTPFSMPTASRPAMTDASTIEK